ncbi:MAG: PSD1 and planctomycete cytochrome C domain-containing protein [Limisphaerales bacterium]
MIRCGNMLLLMTLALAVALGGVQAAESSANPKQPVNFSRQIRPLLSENCFTCHGPDQEQRKAKLRLDTKEGAIASKDGVHIIKPGASAESELIKRLITSDEDEAMPPAKFGKKLTTAQIELLRTWIDQGANWETHWAFEKPVRPELPKVKNTAWPKNEIDYFVLEKLEAEKLAPQPEADKPTLIRRASLDVTGLPPTIEELDAYLADGSPNAYEKVVSRLVDSSRYGEQMTRYWLDGARYADSHGYHIDSTRSIWKYREWVIEAFNKNMPFDQFTVEQIAGDLLPNATTSQKIASGYIRCNMSTGEGGAIEEEYRAKYAFDRLETTSTMWLGLTMTCARCHTHKYDPITHHEYYSLLSFFNNLDEPIMDGNKPNPDPFLKIPSAKQAERQDWLKNSIAKAQEKIDGKMPELDGKQPEWQKQWHEKLAMGWQALDLTGASSRQETKFTAAEDKSLVVESAGDEVTWILSAGIPASRFGAVRLEVLPEEKLDPEKAKEKVTLRIGEIEAELIPADGKAQKLSFVSAAADGSNENSPFKNAIDGKAETDWTLTFPRGEKHLAVLALKEPRQLPESSKLTIRLKMKGRESETALRRFRISAATESDLIANLFPLQIQPWKVIGPFKTEDVKTALDTEFPPEKELDFSKSYPGVRDPIRWNDQPGYEDGKSHVFVQYLHGVHGAYYFHRKIQATAARKLNISLRADDFSRVWLNGKEIARREQKAATGDAPLRVTLDLTPGENQLLIKVVNHQGECRFRFDTFLADPDALPLQAAVILASTSNPAGEEGKLVAQHFRAVHSPDWKSTLDQLVLWREEQEALDRSIPTTLIAKDSSKFRETRVLMRGEYDQLGDTVPHGVPAILPPFPADAPTNRLGFAQWMVQPDHPLVARVVVNRFWQQYFGVGLVKTTEDFGMQSEPPSHPALLDWLATEFVRSGWDMKHIQRLILTSASYRQSSAAPASLYARDPENRFIARGPRFRVDAETLRDTALALGGLLIEEIGGPSVKPYQPPGLWEAVSFNNSQKYDQDHGEEQYRRSLYIHWKRQSPPPNMLLFDAPTREYCVVRRPRTNTPLQALALLNDPQYVEASRGFGDRMLRHDAASDRARLSYAFRLATAREPSAEEIDTLLDVLQKQEADFSKNTAAAEQFLSIGEWKPGAELNKAKLAAWATVAGLILNLDETVTKN